MDPLQWLREKYADITNLPERLQAIANRAHALLSDQRLPSDKRQRAGRVWANANADRAEVVKLLNHHVREMSPAGPAAGLQAWPLLIVVGISAASAAAALVAIFGRASTYEQELVAIASGHVTPAEIEELREGVPVSGGVAGSLREARNLLMIAVVGYGAVWLARRYA